MSPLTTRQVYLALSLSMINQFASALTNANVLRLDPSLLYNIPSNAFAGNVSESFLQTTNLFTNGTTGNNSTAMITKPFVAYDDEFESLFAENATLELVYSSQDDTPVADEMGIWVWDYNQVWMSSASVDNVSYTNILDLSDYTITKLAVSSNGVPIVNPNGGSYDSGKVYLAGDGNLTIPPAIYEVDPKTHDARVVVNSYFGLRLGGPNDMTWAHGGNKSWLFFTDEPQSYYYNGGQAPQLPDATWRWDPQEETLIPVIDRTDILVPNGIRVNKNSTKLYISDTPPKLVPGTGFTETGNSVINLGSGSAAIYVYDLSSDGFPSNKRLFGITQRGISDGMHIDDAGRVWTAEADGIVVRNAYGKVLGMINSLAVQGETVADSDQSPLQNFALAGDKVIVLAYNKIYQVRLSGMIVSGMT
ncbi:uncharacterized protein Z520_04323 [Fonsecaea multimorphosa CBS 102226]|uniref:SMP-30/Gluconolactonase/LRE-like region domain-containing protein n=1 Tax=Fonsecaea multimorphosa CBS 102226 TaxID=1442371 RepID=A0A0D2KSI5_9EURO|nr:uncharacterized protein Z520_04323 [Fonsecaea multimorphosa CBS 102226]KIX99688.1 hypothetical protein Z520_04323 [Fonsecaea multimorphosa CBS 102226]OAL26739.1 hypothetical protein AYO22_04092 [Fonsecaea multimorphosa]